MDSSRWNLPTALSRFIQTLTVGGDQVVGDMFIKWQESTRKDSERAFGVLIRKFQYLARPIEYWEVEEIKDQIYGCIFLHNNMMVQTRIERSEKESKNMYKVVEKEELDAVTREKNLDKFLKTRCDAGVERDESDYAI